MRRREDAPEPGVDAPMDEVFDGPFVLEDWQQPGEKPGRAYVRYLGACRRFRERTEGRR